MLRGITRFFSQHRTLYCYLCMSLWIFLLIAGMYKFISNGNGIPSQAFFNVNKIQHQDDTQNPSKLQICSPEETKQDSGVVAKGWKLQGLLILIRHGDRGPMTHVRGSVDCGASHVLLNKYLSFLNTTTTAPGHYIWNKYGPFHNFPLLPARNACDLGQLTFSGVVQLLKLGDYLRQVYGHLGLTNPISIKRASNSSQLLYPEEEIVILSTRYRRTFQSAMALMFSFLSSPDRWKELVVRESSSISFCFDDCACPLAEQIKDVFDKQYTQQFNNHPTIAAIVQWIGLNIMENPRPKTTTLEILDALSLYLCHNVSLPCHRLTTTDNGRQAVEAASTTEETNDLINIDQESNQDANINNIPGGSNHVVDPDADGFLEPELDCVDKSHVDALMSYARIHMLKQAKHTLTRKEGLLRAYGLIRNIVAQMLKILSEEKTKLVLYSAHDRTLQFLTAALGLYSSSNTNSKQPSFSIPYASRLAFEIYRSEADNGDLVESFFRVVFNGQDVTRQIEFCEGGRSLRISKDSRGNKADLCPIENIIRFIHDDYFQSFNATNLKDACTINKNSEF